MHFPIDHLMDEDACYQQLLDWLHPDGLACPGCGGGKARIHRFDREPVLDYRGKDCGKL